jgi:hypothetical protein
LAQNARVYTSDDLVLMKTKPCVLLALSLCSVTIDVPAQANDPKAPDHSLKAAPSSTVNGHVYLDDTKAPARKAQVYLEPATSLETDAPPNQTTPANAGPITASVETRFDGSYSFTHVAPGSYYVVASCPGYVSPFLQVLLAQDRSPSQGWNPLGPEQKKNKDRLLRSLTRIEVQSNLSATADLTLERGAAISGNVSYDDSGPAAGLQVKALVPISQGGKKAWTEIFFPQNDSGPMGRSVTDDRGNYRINGLPSGEYVIEAELLISNTKTYSYSSGSTSSSSNPTSLPIYSGNTSHPKDAAAFTLQPREERTGEDIVLPTSKLRTIKGNIVSARDGHIINHGNLVLENASDHTPVGNESLAEDDPDFTFSFVFDGDYILTTYSSSDADYVPAARIGNNFGPPQFDAHPRHFYGSASMPLHVAGDIDGLTIAVPERTPRETQIYEDAVRQQQPRATAPQ